MADPMSAAASAVSSPAPARVLELARRGMEVLLLAVVPLSLLGVLVFDFAIGFHTFDFLTFWESGRAVFHGRSPYPDALPALAQRTTFRPFVYPAPAAVAMVPFALLPLTVADVLFAVLGVAAVVCALRLLGVRDWRCHGAALASFPIFDALGNGSISALLLLGAAALWRYRDRTWAAGVLLAALVAAKLFLWPIGIWLIATKRLRATAAAIGICVAGALAAWALLGFAGFSQYPHLLGRLTSLVAPDSFSPYALVLALGGSAGAARLVTFAGGAAILAGVALLARGTDGDRRAYTLAIGAALFLSPIVWPHYLAVLFAPVAIASRRLSAAWLAPLGLWLATGAWSYGRPSLILPLLVVTAVTLVLALRPRPAPRLV
jgi:hypothetical protein